MVPPTACGWHSNKPRYSFLQQIRQHGQEERLKDLIQNTHGYSNQSHLQGIGQKHSIWRQENDSADSVVRLMRDQLIMAKVYVAIAQAHQEGNLMRDLKLRIKESQRAIGELSFDVELPKGYDPDVEMVS